MRIYLDKNRKKNNRPACWCVEINYKEKRRRKFFKDYKEARLYDVNEWILSLSDEPDGTDTLVKQGIELYLKDYAERYPEGKIQQLENRLSWLLKWGLGDEKLDDLDESFLARKVSQQSSWTTQSSKFTYKNAFVIFLNWCGAVGYCRKKEWKIKTIRVKPKAREIGVLTVGQTKALLAEINPKYRTPMAIMLFAGLRPQGEMEKLKYEHISHGKWIDVPASKTPKRLIEGLPENIWSWIPKNGKGHILSSWNALRLNRRRTASKLGFNYPADGARHSFATYGYWLKGLEWTMHSMGHMNYETFKKYYKNPRVPKTEAEKYFSIKCVSDIHV
jgi:hypothetical protein